MSLVWSSTHCLFFQLIICTEIFCINVLNLWPCVISLFLIFNIIQITSDISIESMNNELLCVSQIQHSDMIYNLYVYFNWRVIQMSDYILAIVIYIGISFQKCLPKFSLLLILTKLVKLLQNQLRCNWGKCDVIKWFSI